jgi:uncharacterized protein (TIGR01777 family)
MEIVIAGGTGFVGNRLTKLLLRSGARVTVLSRSEVKLNDELLQYVKWSPGSKAEKDWSWCIDGAHAVVNLSGAPLSGKRWSRKQKDGILNSRLKATRAIAEAIKKASNPPKVLVSGSAVGYYGNGGEKELTESSPCGKGFLAEVCMRWEAEAHAASGAGTRVCFARTGIVLGREGGMIRQMEMMLRYFVSAKFGNGKQWMPWIHADDEAKAIKFLIDSKGCAGAYNLASPNPVRNLEFSEKLSKYSGRKGLLKPPEALLRAAAGEMAEEMIFTSQRVFPKRLEKAGYRFSYPSIDNALKEIFG